MNIKDYLHLYLGCEVVITTPRINSEKKILNGFDNINEYFRVDYMNGDYCDATTWHTVDKIKPILRHLSDMTDDERRQWLDFRLNSRIEPERSFQLSEATRTKFLLSKHFDLFGLIEAGLAIDKNKTINNGR